jgi:hypothetical protein
VSRSSDSTLWGPGFALALKTTKRCSRACTLQVAVAGGETRTMWRLRDSVGGKDFVSDHVDFLRLHLKKCLVSHVGTGQVFS